MKCYNHEQRDAVATCAGCQMSFCRACFDWSRGRGSENPLCPKCWLDTVGADFVIAKDALEKAKAEAEKNKTSVIIFSVLYVIGIVLMASASHNEGVLIAGVILMGIPTIRIALEIGGNAAKSLNENFLSKAFCFLFATAITFIFGVFISPIIIISRLIKIPFKKKEIEAKQGSFDKISSKYNNLAAEMATL